MGLHHKNLQLATVKYLSGYRKHRQDLGDKQKTQPNTIFIHKELANKAILDYRTIAAREFRRLEFRQYDLILKKEQLVIKKEIKTPVEGISTQTQYNILGYKINLYFHSHKISIEIDETGCSDRNIYHEINKKKKKTQKKS